MTLCGGTPNQRQISSTRILMHLDQLRFARVEADRLPVGIVVEERGAVGVVRPLVELLELGLLRFRPSGFSGFLLMTTPAGFMPLPKNAAPNSCARAPSRATARHRRSR
jgi:hypothetical protein